MHAGDPGYTKYANEWEGVNFEANFGSVGTPGFLALMSDKNALIDAMASIVGHGLATEACAAVVDFGFKQLKLERMEMRAGVRNRASCRLSALARL